MPDPALPLLRHAVAALSYRAARACENAPPNFAEVRASESTRTAGAILCHMGDLFDWAAKLALGKHEWKPAEPLPWEREVNRFFTTLGRFDAILAEGQLACSAEKLLQGPISDALTHVGQLAMLRRLAGSPMIGESYFGADISVGHITPQLPAPAAPFKK
ncbi:MAG: hypothetical protein ACJ8C4_14530 [Gemmataceae bacterium]